MNKQDFTRRPPVGPKAEATGTGAKPPRESTRQIRTAGRNKPEMPNQAFNVQEHIKALEETLENLDAYMRLWVRDELQQCFQDKIEELMEHIDEKNEDILAKVLELVLSPIPENTHRNVELILSSLEELTEIARSVYRTEDNVGEFHGRLDAVEEMFGEVKDSRRDIKNLSMRLDKVQNAQEKSLMALKKGLSVLPTRKETN